MLIATAQLAYPNYVAEVWHVYLVYLGMIFFSYIVICLPTRYVSWFNIGATAMGILVLIVTTIILPIEAPQLNSGKAIFTEVRALCNPCSRYSRSFAGVQPDRLANRMGVLHDLPIRDVDS